MNTRTAHSTSDNDITENQYLLRSGKRKAIPRLNTSMKRDTSPETEKISDLSEDTQQNYSRVKLVAPVINFTMLQQWEGRVISVSKDSFVAIISNRTDSQKPQEEIEIELNEIPHDDTNLIRPGAFFYWSIGYEDGPGIPRQRVSRIRFRRLPKWTKREINQARNQAKVFSNLFK
ncbi:MAG: hypothetical protein H6936_08715 [Burkholderiales bacterium]|nr:hypothetical protein [Burkholderiales bacterium]